MPRLRERDALADRDATPPRLGEREALADRDGTPPLRERERVREVDGNASRETERERERDGDRDTERDTDCAPVQVSARPARSNAQRAARMPSRARTQSHRR